MGLPALCNLEGNQLVRLLYTRVIAGWQCLYYRFLWWSPGSCSLSVSVSLSLAQALAESEVCPLMSNFKLGLNTRSSEPSFSLVPWQAAHQWFPVYAEFFCLLNIYVSLLDYKPLKQLPPQATPRPVEPAGLPHYIQCLAKVFGPLELCDLLPHFRLQT